MIKVWHLGIIVSLLIQSATIANAYHGSDSSKILSAVDHTNFDKTRKTNSGIAIHSYGDSSKLTKISFQQNGYDKFFDHKSNLAAVVIENGKVVYERYNNQLKISYDTPLNGMSITKSASAAVIGTLLCDGKIASLTNYANQYSSYLSKTPYSKVSIENILRMASGVPSSGDGQGKFLAMAMGVGPWKGKGSIKNAMGLIKKSNNQQGKRFLYHQADAFALSLISHDITGVALSHTFYNQIYKKFTKNGRLHWHADSEGFSLAFSGLVMRPRDWAYCGDYILSEIQSDSCLGKFFTEGMAKSIATKYSDKTGKKYGFMSWVHDLDGSPVLSFRGHGGQLLAIYPKINRVIYVASVDKKYNFGLLFKDMNKLLD